MSVVTHNSSYWQLTREANGSVLLRRTSTPFPTVEHATQEFAELVRILRADTEFTGGLVVNGTAVQGRNDPAYEKAVKPYMDQLVSMSRRVGFVMQSALGTLQVRRLSGNLATPIEFFTDDQTALAYVAPRPGDVRSTWGSSKPKPR